MAPFAGLSAGALAVMLGGGALLEAQPAPTSADPLAQLQVAAVPSEPLPPATTAPDRWDRGDRTSRSAGRKALSQPAARRVNRKAERGASPRAERRDRPVEPERGRRAAQATRWVLPTKGYHLSARFGESSYLWSGTHTGLDFAGPPGTPVVAVTAGKVSYVGYAGPYGNKVVLRHGNGTATWYCHLDGFSVEEGARVQAGQQVGILGSTGNVTGAHLHFEVRSGGAPVDPYTALSEAGVEP